MKKILATISILLATTAATAEDYKTSKEVWRVCSSCHGTKAEGKPGFPGLQTLDQAQIVEALQDYKAGVYRGDMSAIMFGQAANLSDEEIDKMAKYIKEVLAND